MAYFRIDHSFIGRHFGSLTVIERSGQRRYGKTRMITTMWLCRCSCGTSVHVLRQHLVQGRIRSCGRKGCRIFDDLSGQKFSFLTVLHPTLQRTTSGGIIYICRCICGQHVKLSAHSLRRAHNKSCGCMRRKLLCDIGRDLSGQQIGYWTIMEKVYIKKRNGKLQLRWLSTCRCGRVKAVDPHSLHLGRSLSCGCANQNPAHRRHYPHLNDAKVREKFSYYGWRCRYCGVSLTGSIKPTIDHAIPVHRGGKHYTSNLLPACFPCNRSKADSTFFEFIHRHSPSVSNSA
jgi:hypothetical protein